MAQRGIREYDAKRLLAKYMPQYQSDFSYQGKIVLVSPETDLDESSCQKSLAEAKEKLVVKPDQLFGKRGKHGLILLDATWQEAQSTPVGEHGSRESSRRSGRKVDSLPGGAFCAP